MTQDPTQLDDERISSVESLLQQLELQRPGPLLDDRVAASLAAADQTIAQSGRPAVFRSLLVVTAVASLLLGIAIGRTAQQDSETAAEFTQDDTSPERQDNSGTPMQTVEAVTLQPLLAVARESPEQIYQSASRVPRVALMCGLVGLSIPSEGSGGDQCLSCHTGRQDAHSEFRRRHMKHLTPESCGLCHDTTRDNEPQPDLHGHPQQGDGGQAAISDESLTISLLSSTCVMLTP